MSVSLSTFTEVALVNTTSASGIIVVPPANSIPYRVVVFKDRLGTFQTNSLTLSTQGGNTFEDDTTTKIVNTRFGFISLYSDGVSKWHTLNGSQLVSMNISSLIVSTIQGNGSQLTNVNAISTLSLVSSLVGLGTLGYVSTASLTSTVQGLGSANYVSTLSLVSTTQGLQTGYATAGFLSTANLISTVQGLGSAGYVSTTALGAYFSSVSTSYAVNFITSSLTFSTATGSNATISSVTANQILFGTGNGWIQAGAIQATVVSSVQINTNVLYANSNFFGTVSSQTALQFYGLQGNYNNTVIAEQSTGTGTQELLLFKGSSASDQVRIQTTGGFRLETGVSSRLWPTYTQAVNPALYVDINSNVGIGTASPAALLDVVGQGRFQVVSTLQLNISSINGATFGSPINSTVIGLGSAGYVSTLSLVSTTQGLQRGYQTAGFLSTANLTSTVEGLGSANYISTLSLTSTALGLGTLGYISSLSSLRYSTGTLSLSSLILQDGNNSNRNTLQVSSGVLLFNTSTLIGLYASSYVSQGRLTSNQTITPGADNTITFAVDFDPQGWYNTGTYRFAPSIPGYYYLSFGVWWNNGTTNQQDNVQARKNGNTFMILQNPIATGTSGISASGSKLIYLNGVSDYVDFTAYTANATSQILQYGTATGSGTWFSAYLLTGGGGGSGGGGQVNTSTISEQNLTSTVVGLGTVGYISTTQLISTTAGILGSVVISGVLSTANLTSTVQGLGSANYVSTLSLVSTTQGLQTGYATAGFLSTPNLISTVAGLGTVGYLSTTALGPFFSSLSTSYALNFITSSLTFSTATGSNATISTVTTNQVGIGSNGGWILAGALQTVILSTVQINTNVLYANSNFFGTVSSQTALQFFGLQGNYNNTVIAEQSTGTGTQELLLFKGSSASDQVRIQTTGGFRLETGVSSRLWPTYTQAANPALYVDINSNVGIGTASPGALLDVVGQGRFQVVSTLQLNISSINGATFGSPINSTVIGLGSAGYVSTLSLVSTTAGILANTSVTGVISTANLTSTVQGLGSANYVSTLSLVSTTAGILANTSVTGVISTANLTSTVQGLGSANYVSTLSLVSTTAGLIDITELNSTVAGLGTAGYVSTTALGPFFSSVSTSYALNFITSSLRFSTATGSNATISSVTANQFTVGTNGGWLVTGALQTAIVSSIQINTNLLYANSNFFGTVSSQTALQFFGLQGNYNNTVIAEQSTGTGTQELLLFKGSSASDQVRIQTTGGFRLETGVSSRLWPTYTQAANPALFVDINSNVGIGTASPGALLDVVGQGRFQVVSTLQLNISSINGATFGSPINSTVIGLGSAGYVSTLSLVSTTAGILANTSVTGVISTANLTSTVQGLGSANYVSTLSLVSTTAGLIDITELNSTVAGLGTAGYLSTAALGPFFSSFSTSYALNFITSSLTFSTATGSNATISTVTTNQLTVGSNGGWLLAGAIQTAIMSSVQINTNLLYTNSNFFGTVSSQTALQFYGLQGNYNNTVIAEQSTGTGTQELLLFKGSSASDQVRIQTTGGFRLETGVSSRLWPTYAQPANPALYVDINSNVGIGTASPGALLDVVGQGRFQVVSTLQLNISSINGATFGSPINSTVIGLGTAGYVSSLSLVSTTQGLQRGYQTAGFISTANEVSTVVGLGSAGYVSTLSLVSTTQGLQTAYTTAGFLSTANLTSTVAGLGTAGYLSTTALGAYFSSVSTSYALNFITSSLTFSTATGSNATISTVTTNQVGIGSNGGWLQTGALQAIAVSSIQLNTNVLYANSNFFGTVSSQTALQFYGLLGNYNNTVIAEQSTGTGTQELLLFKGSSASDQVRIQTTGGFRLETGVSSRLWPTYAQPANPAVYVDINSNVGIGTASPAALLDVVGQGRFQVVSTLQLNISSINGATFGSPINSTVIGLGSAGYLSSSALGPYFSSVSTSYALKFITSSITASSITTSSFSTFQGAASTFTLDILQFATGTGWLGMGPIQPYAVSTIVTNTSTLCVGMATSVFPFDVGSMAHMSSLMLGGSALSTANAYSLAVFGDAAKTTGTSWTAISDKRIKDNIAEADYTICYNDIKKLPLRRYTYSSSMIETYSLKDKRVLGFIAQEVSTIQPKSITLAPILNIDDAMWLNTEQVFFSLYGTVKKVLFDKEILESTTKSLVTLNTNLTQRVSTLEGLVVRSLGGNV